MAVTSIDISGSQGVTPTGGPITTSGTINVGLGDITPNSINIQQTAGNVGLTFANNSIITGDFSSSALTRSFFKTSVANARTVLTVTANGTPAAGSYTGFQAFGNQSNTNFSQLTMGINEASNLAIISSSKAGTGVLLPLSITTGAVGTTGITVETTGDTTIKNNITVSGTSQFNNTVNIGSATYPTHLTIIGGSSSDAELYIGNSVNSGVIAMDAGNATYPVSMFLSNPSGIRSVEFNGAQSSLPAGIGVFSIDGINLDVQILGGDGSTYGGSVSANGVNLNGDICIRGTLTGTGNSATSLTAVSYAGLNDVSIDIYPQNNGTINVTHLNVSSGFTTISTISGNITLSAGTATVNSVEVTSNSVILLTVGTLGTVTVPKAVHWNNRVAGTSFDIVSADPTDTSVVSWFIIG